MTTFFVKQASWPVAEIIEDLGPDLAWLERRAAAEDQLGALHALLMRFLPTSSAAPTPAPVMATAQPRALSLVARATEPGKARLHEAAHGVVAELLGVPVGALVTFGAGGAGETRHDEAGPRESALVALAGVVIGDVAHWRDPVGIADDQATARAAAELLDPDDPDAALERLTVEARDLVADNLAVIARLADVLERFGGRLAGDQLCAALDYAFARPRPMPVPGPAPREQDVLDRFRKDRRAWLQHLAAGIDHDDQAATTAAFLEADRRALARELPPRKDVGADRGPAGVTTTTMTGTTA
jgi:hypothetical protein